jgi:hypothetical protein
MNVVRLQVENIMRLVALDITPEGYLITIGGLNNAGKSSVLNSIAMLLGGAAMCPPEPIRDGETEGWVQGDLGDLIVKRTYTRERLVCSCASFNDPAQAVSEDASLHADACNWRNKLFGETKSTLIVTNREGARYPSPQAVLDKLHGVLMFDPLKFANDAKEDPKRAADVLRKLVDLDVTPFETQRAEAASKRAMLKKSHDIKQAQLLGLPEHKDAGLVEISMDEVSKEMLLAEQYRKVAEEAEREADKVKTDLAVIERDIVEQRGRVETLQRQLLGAQVIVEKLESRFEDRKRNLDARSITAQSARAVVPDVEVIRKKLAIVEATNVKVRANQKRIEAEAEVGALKRQVAEQDTAVKNADVKKKAALEAVKFPVPGLGINDEGVTFGSLPFSQASSSEQLRVSVAIGIALNPTLKVLLVRNGNLLDDAHMEMLAKQAEEAGMQVWVEYVTSDAGDVSVMIEEGRVKE